MKGIVGIEARSAVPGRRPTANGVGGARWRVVFVKAKSVRTMLGKRMKSS